ncbi:hypothetical protein T12_6523, partial [Trichinella patagoniensis]
LLLLFPLIISTDNIYWFPLNDTIPGRSERGHNHIRYYQWVPFISGVQELFFIQFVSALFVRVCNFRS